MVFHTKERLSLSHEKTVNVSSHNQPVKGPIRGPFRSQPFALPTLIAPHPPPSPVPLPPLHLHVWCITICFSDIPYLPRDLPVLGICYWCLRPWLWCLFWVVSTTYQEHHSRSQWIRWWWIHRRGKITRERVQSPKAKNRRDTSCGAEAL